MSMHLHLRCAAACLLFAGPMVFGQTPHQQENVSLDSLIAFALAHNPDILAAEQRSYGATQREAQVSTLDDPVVSYSHWLSTPETRVGPQTDAFTLSQAIPFPGKLSLKGNMANEDALAESKRYEVTKRDVIFRVKTAYCDLYRVDRSLAILDEYLNTLRNFSKVSEERYATGEGIQANVLKSQVEISSVLERRLAFERQRASVASRINALIDMPADTPVGMAASLDTTRVRFADSALVNTALSDRQELNISAAMIRKSEMLNSLASLQYYPNFILQAGYVIVARGSSTAADAGKDAYSIGIGVTIPIQLGRRAAATEEAEAALKANQLSYRNMENTVRAEIADLHFQLQSTERSLDLYRLGLLAQSQSSLESALAAYGSGRIDFMGLLDSERMLLQARLGFVEQETNYRKTLAALERAVGGNFAQ